MARSSMWITIASVLAAFEISPVVDSKGIPQLPKEEYTAGPIASVVGFLSRSINPNYDNQIS